MIEKENQADNMQDDVVLFLTEKCNSNCIMCPMSPHSRMRGLYSDEWRKKLQYACDINAHHITITGGEPFLEFESLMHIISVVKAKLPLSSVLIITNGRALAIPEIANRFIPEINEFFRVAIPIHASSEELHDTITQSKGSFKETMAALQHLQKSRAQIEVRVVAHHKNMHDLSNIYHMLMSEKIRISQVNLVAMEMNGTAARNRSVLWTDYSELYRNAEEGIHSLIHAGINAGLYNFPLCSIPRDAWSIAYQSISPGKVRFPSICDDCVEKHACCGLFASTFHLGCFKVHPIWKENT